MSMEEADWVEELEKQEKGLTGKVNLQKHDHVVIYPVLYTQKKPARFLDLCSEDFSTDTMHMKAVAYMYIACGRTYVHVGPMKAILYKEPLGAE